jgi:hypothetical protein
MDDDSCGIVITPAPAVCIATVGVPTVWVSDNFSEDWFSDALKEARSGTDFNARRREIIFAACFAESYLFEWTRRRIEIEEEPLAKVIFCVAFLKN